jgi:integrase
LTWGITGLPEISWGALILAEPKPKARDFTDAQIAAIIVALPEHWRDMTALMARYGLRLGEVFVDLERIDMEGKRLTLTDRKGGDDHVIPLMAEDAAMLAARAGRARAAGLDSPWFRVLKGGRLKALAYGGALQAIHTAMRETGLKASRGARVHDLRHHAGTRIMRATGNLRVAQRLLGHASIQSTIKYAYASDDDLRDGLEKLLEARNIPGPSPKKERKAKQKQSLG